jgi:glycosyltransferase involved in cell wall biosynthesis
MRICLNALLYYPDELGGVETYFRNLVRHLPEAGAGGSEEYDFLILGHHQNASRLPTSHSPWRVDILSYGRPSLGWLIRGLWLRLGGADFLAPYVDALSADVVHHPFTMMSPLQPRTPSVLTFHDMQQEFLPEHFRASVLRARAQRFRASVMQATRVIAISQHVKKTLVSRYEVDPERVDVVYQGCDPEFRRLDRAGREAARAWLHRRYGIEPPFLLYPAATWPHKNHLRLLQAIRQLVDGGRFDGELVLTGLAMEADDEVSRAIRQLGLSARVHRLGYLPGTELPKLYNTARALVFPSLFEGFGIPLVEAMACGCPVVASRATSLPEVGGEAVEYFDPWQVDSIARAIDLVWSQPSRRETLRTAGLARAALFTWSEAASQTIAVYRSAVRAHRHPSK